MMRTLAIAALFILTAAMGAAQTATPTPTVTRTPTPTRTITPTPTATPVGVLTGKDPRDTYGDLLHIDNAGAGLTATPRAVYDGVGSAAGWQVGTGGVRVPTAATIDLDGTVRVRGTPVSLGSAPTITKTYSWVIASPSTGGIPGPRIPAASTVTRIDAYVTAATSATFNVEERGTIGSAGTDLNGADIAADVTGETSTTFTNAGLAAGNWIWLDISGAVGTPGSLVVTVTVTEP